MPGLHRVLPVDAKTTQRHRKNILILVSKTSDLGLILFVQVLQEIEKS